MSDNTMSKTMINPMNDIMMGATAPNNTLTQDELSSFRNILGIPERNAFLEVITKFSEVMKVSLEKYNNLAEDIQDMKFTQLQHTEAINRLAASNNAIAESNGGIAKAIYVVGNKLEKTQTAHSTVKAIKNSGLFYSTYNDNQKDMWIKKINGDICAKCLKADANNTAEFFDALYSDMKTKDKYDVWSLLEDYKTIDPAADIIKMCANSDALRQCVEKRVNNLYINKMIKTKKTGTSATRAKYHEYHRCPESIKSLIKKITGVNRPAGIQYNKILSQILSDTNMSKDTIISQVSEELGVANCNVWFAVSKYPAIVNALQELAATK